MSDTLRKYKLDRNAPYGNWTVRRRIIISTLLFCACTVIWVLYKNAATTCTLANTVPVDPDLAVKTAVVQFSYMLAGGVIGSYVFGATWEDRKKFDILNEEVDSGNPPNTQNAVAPNGVHPKTTIVDQSSLTGTN